jgi:hypothetical protein
MASSRVGTCAQIRRIWSIAATKLRSGKGVQIGGSRATAATNDRDAALPLLKGVSDLIE